MKKLCVVGGGYWGKNHIKTLHGLDSLGCIVEQNDILVKKYSALYPEVEIYQDVEEPLKNNLFSGYIIATPAETHYDIAKKILMAKKHLLVEKPFALNINHAEELVVLSKQKKVNLMVGHLLLFHPAIKKIKKVLLDGEIGKLKYIYSNRLNFGQVRNNENVFWSFAPHDISLFQFFTDSFPLSVELKGSDFLKNNIYDSTITTLKYPDSIDGHIFLSWLHPFKEHRLVLIGTDGMISFEDSNQDKSLRLFKSKYKIKSDLPEKIDGDTVLIDYEKKMPLTEELKYFINHLDGKPLEICNADHALEVTNILVSASK